jgi:phytoene dehydrogenase-like protein
MAETVLVVGGGPAGITAAYNLKKQGFNPIVIEKQAQLGGMCSTYKISPQRMTERGAVLVAPNYPILKEMKEVGVNPEKKVSVRPLSDITYYDSLSYTNWRKYVFSLSFLKQQLVFASDVFRYNLAKSNHSDLPPLYEKPFSVYLNERGFDVALDSFRGFLPGCGYGAFERIKTWHVFEYLGYTTLLHSALPGDGLKVVQGGYQHLFEKMAQDIESHTDAVIRSIERKGDKVSLTLTQNGNEKKLEGDKLLLAIPPSQWTSLGMNLTPLETRCVNELNSIKYPIVIAKIKNMPKEFIFFENALEQDGFNNVALITTRDLEENPESGRLSTIYLNTDENFDTSLLDDETRLKPWLEEQIKKGIDSPEVEILEVKNWDYFRHLDWGLRNQLKSTQGDNKTFYAGSYLSFEDVACATQSAKDAVEKITAKSLSYFERAKTTLSNLWFFYHPHTQNEVEPVNQPVMPGNGI